MQVLAERWVLTLATNAPEHDPPVPPADAPYVAPLFYAVAALGQLAPGPALLFTSRPGTRHGQHVGAGPTPVAAAIYLETEQVGCIRGVQMRGWCVPASRLSPDDADRAREIYLARHPVAANLLRPRAPLENGPAHVVYCLAVGWAKLTDNRLGFGTHPVWEFAHPWPDLGENRL